PAYFLPYFYGAVMCISASSREAHYTRIRFTCNPPANTFLCFLSEWTFYRQTHRQIVQISIGQGKITFSNRAKGAKSLRFPGRDTR
ncbi:hypothetical protein SJ359_17575, partial [Raoultella ornithinolytica]|uniref:hypothetical protein n=1 Tax=Raoultella ornithinolytica TaxID=54291 RepID=UPI0029D51BFE